MARDNGGVDALFDEMRDAVEVRLDALLPTTSAGPASLVAAERYTLLLPAKRVRALLTVLVTQAWNNDWRRAVNCACAVEMVHAASLIVDDLPCMDDATLRRGRTPCHIAHGEATAILAAFGLMNRGFSCVSSDDGLSDQQKVAVVDALSYAIGPLGLTGGQEDDLHLERVNQADIERVHHAKTAALFGVATEIGSIVADIRGTRRSLMNDCGASLGLAFQAFDDLLDFGSSQDATGKSEQRVDKATNLGAVVGQDQAFRIAEGHVAVALECLEASGADTPKLQHFVQQIVTGLKTKLGPLSGPAHKA